MSNQQRGPPGSFGGVAQARERVEVDMQPSASLQPPSQNRTRPQMPSALAESRKGRGVIGAAISRPTQVPQWPLASAVDGMRDAGSPDQYQPPAGRAMPPQRPPRPSRVPSILDGSRVQEHTPSFPYKPQTADRNPNETSQLRLSVGESIITSPLTPTSRQSTSSSIGTIPDFPVPAMPPPAITQPPSTSRKSNTLGPPLSSRRGTSSYYSQGSLVSPIPEESPDFRPSQQRQHDSYASSGAMPPTWDGASSYLDDEYDKETMYDGQGYGSGYWPQETIEEGRESRESNLDDNDDRGLIRSASLGKRAKPSVVTTRPPDKQGHPQKFLPGKLGAAGAIGSATAMNSQSGTALPIMGGRDSPLAGGTGFIDSKSISSSEEVVSEISKPVTANSNQTVSPMQSTVRTPEEGRKTGFRRLSLMRPPKPIDLNAIRDREARGSLTSLPDLIRRATRLASMMDRGKRPGSRFNDFNDFKMAADTEKGGPPRRRGSTLSGMLAAFPPPGLASPAPDAALRMSSWPQKLDGGSPEPDEKAHRPRRCCGLPVWGFVLVLLIIIIIIAAAVVVPLELLVLHKKSTPASTPADLLRQCQSASSTTCQNGGSSILSTGSCSCICINGFTGSTCTVGGTTGCTATTIAGVSNVTLGYAIPRLISDAQSNFSIPLVPSTLLARFNSANLSCISENALVTFDGQSQSSDVVKAIAKSTPSTTTTSAPSSATSSGVISTTSEFFKTPFNSTQNVQNFARVAVLFLLQQDDLNSASTAQTQLQHFFDTQNTTNQDALNVTLGGGNSANLVELSVQLGNGTTFGGPNESTST